MNSVLTIWDPILTPVYIFFIYLIAYRIKATQIDKHPEYKYFVKGLTFKIFGALAFALIYVFYYNGGDTHTYFLDAKVITNMLFHKPSVALSILSDHLTVENYSNFDATTKWPHLYIWKDHNTFTVIRYTTPLCILGAATYLPTTILVSCLSYAGIWKLFQLFIKIYPKHKKILSITILFLPSFVFWGSGIMKDTYIIGATCWITYNFYQIFISRKQLTLNIILLIINFIVILNIKPYVIACLVPSMLIWINQAYIRKIKSSFFKVMLLPFVLLLVSVGGYYIFLNVGSSMGDYGKVDTAIERAKITQQDLLREDSYGSNSYNLGEIDGTLGGMVKLAPIAIFTAIYRPFITEARNILMIFSSLENLVLLGFTIIIFIKSKPRKIFIIIKQQPLIAYSVVFSIILAFGVGIATANFGALVRYKIPLIPFYFSSLFLIYKISESQKKSKKLILFSYYIY